MKFLIRYFSKFNKFIYLCVTFHSFTVFFLLYLKKQFLSLLFLSLAEINVYNVFKVRKSRKKEKMKLHFLILFSFLFLVEKKSTAQEFFFFRQFTSSYFFYAPCHFRTQAIMTLHKFVSFVNLSNFFVSFLSLVFCSTQVHQAGYSLSLSLSLCSVSV